MRILIQFIHVILDAGSQEVQPMFENHEICTNHEDCEARRAQIKITKGFVAKEPMKGHMASSIFHKLNFVFLYRKIYVS